MASKEQEEYLQSLGSGLPTLTNGIGSATNRFKQEAEAGMSNFNNMSKSEAAGNLLRYSGKGLYSAVKDTLAAPGEFIGNAAGAIANSGFMKGLTGDYNSQPQVNNIKPSINPSTNTATNAVSTSKPIGLNDIQNVNANKPLQNPNQVNSIQKTVGSDGRVVYTNINTPMVDKGQELSGLGNMKGGVVFGEGYSQQDIDRVNNVAKYNEAIQRNNLALYGNTGVPGLNKLDRENSNDYATRMAAITNANNAIRGLASMGDKTGEEIKLAQAKNDLALQSAKQMPDFAIKQAQLDQMKKINVLQNMLAEGLDSEGNKLSDEQIKKYQATLNMLTGKTPAQPVIKDWEFTGVDGQKFKLGVEHYPNGVIRQEFPIYDKGQFTGQTEWRFATGLSGLANKTPTETLKEERASRK